MKDKVLEIINYIRLTKELVALHDIKPSDKLRDEIGFTSFDLAELTVRIEEVFDIDIFEDGIVETVDEIYKKLKL